ncbi:MAG TPA: nucleotide sugar dehydrogenase [Bacteroidales bacterium]|nr:MAG: UDP-N-acetyl-D-galactosamine dehydrogenase [Bacteroidetes bacterium GWE2_42_24]OFY32402.1 MAG: UDP-N-acetyl-D-galactosamine dehydrogenase [Bacteroidetes bacterium GWF2_43_11]HAQ64582.1 nucleotide sugar dehydrogenase [Bacteroidales bacterium]HBZ68212.1 nucleotide sugar dehydrogenase [Bacteroidales bacterium]
MEHRICMIGLGYVGLPLAVEFAKHYPVVGFDIHQGRVDELNTGHDSTLEVDDENLRSVLTMQQPVGKGLFLTTKLDDIRVCNTYIVTVPTPVDKNNRPDLTPLIKASESIGRVIHKGDIVIYESTVYPGCTEEDCLPVIERVSGMKLNDGFFAGYSPERINPGDKEHTVTTIFKVTSGSTPEIAEVVDQLYKRVIKAGTHKAPSIKVAESAKVIENSQRDINIAFVNELARICAHLNIDTHDVLEAAGTKWNFLKFSPGLVGGHCIGVDPYYMAQRAQEAGYHPEIILAGRRMNDGMGAWIASQIVKLMIRRDLPVNNARALVLGITFKENCPDIRNTKVVDVVHELEAFGVRVDIYDPWALPAPVMHEYNLKLAPSFNLADYDAIVLAVSHREFKDFDLSERKDGSVVYDIKSFWPKESVDGRL